MEMLDKFFDCLNVADFNSGKFSRNAFKSPYHSSRDFRLKVLHFRPTGLYVQCLRTLSHCTYISGLKRPFFPTLMLGKRVWMGEGVLEGRERKDDLEQTDDAWSANHR